MNLFLYLRPEGVFHKHLKLFETNAYDTWYGDILKQKIFGKEKIIAYTSK